MQPPGRVLTAPPSAGPPNPKPETRNSKQIRIPHNPRLETPRRGGSFGFASSFLNLALNGFNSLTAEYAEYAETREGVVLFRVFRVFRGHP
jgi:hypothetical protein